jgi:hypothetical protein
MTVLTVPLLATLAKEAKIPNVVNVILTFT